MSSLQSAYDNIMSAICSEDLFGPISGGELSEKLKTLNDRYKRLAETVDPGAFVENLDDQELAKEAFQRVQQFYDRAKQKLEIGIYGQRLDEHLSASAITTSKRTYFVEDVIAQGDIATIYKGGCIGGDDFAGQVAIKIVNDKADNDLATNEKRVLTLFKNNPGKQSKHLPFILDDFVTTDGRVGLVMRYLEGYTLYQVRDNPRYREGVPQKHAVWMMNRLLSVVGFAHSLGILHNNIEPGNCLIQPIPHNLLLLDWTAAVVDPKQTGEQYLLYNEEFNAPEVKEKLIPLPSSDLYSIGKVMIFLLGGDLSMNTFPSDVELELQNFLHYFVLPSGLQRPQDAWQMHGQLIKLVESLWGPRKYLEFPM